MSKKAKQSTKATTQKTNDKQKSAAKATEKKAAAPEAKASSKANGKAQKQAKESRVDQLYRKVGTDKVYRVTADDGGSNARVIRVMPDGSTKGDVMVVNMNGFERVDAAPSVDPDAAVAGAGGPSLAAPRASTKPFEHDPRVPPVGVVIKKEHKGRLLEVTVEPDGFSFDGKPWRSLTAITREVTGISNPNGFNFFELNGEAKRRSLDLGAVRFALSMLPDQYAPLREVEIERVLEGNQVDACADAAERLEKARTLLNDSAKALGAALRVVGARRAELEKGTDASA